jgi:Xaa-Pro aminopeptidase
MMASAPFDHTRLDAAMAAAGLDLILATSKHNVRYLLGGYECHFFATTVSIGPSRYLPVVGYPIGDPAGAFFLGSIWDAAQQAREPIWIPDVRNRSFMTTDIVAETVADALTFRRATAKTIGVEFPFLPVATFRDLCQRLPEARFEDATRALEDLRAVKSPGELGLLKQASEAIVDAMRAVFSKLASGLTTRDIHSYMQSAEAERGLEFDYCFVTGPDRNRTPGEVRIEPGWTINLDSGGNLQGYIGDLSRNAILGEPSKTQARLLAEIDLIQIAAKKSIKAGAVGSSIYGAARAAIAECEHSGALEFLAHGMGLVSHEYPRISSDMFYAPDHADSPLEAGMVLSIETTVSTPELGFVKLEDTVAVTETGWDEFGTGARGWNIT